jgi:hypothetical protein
VLHGEPQKVTAKVRCPREVGKNWDPLKGRAGTTSTRPLCPTWVMNPETLYTDTASPSSHVPQGILARLNIMATYHIERTGPRGVEQRSSGRLLTINNINHKSSI